MPYSYSLELAKFFIFDQAKKIKPLKVEQRIVESPKVTEIKTPKLTIPVPTIQSSFNLGGVSQLLQDKTIKLIQCDGSRAPLKISQNNEMIQVDLALNEEEINEIIRKFSLRSGTPLTEPVFQAEFQDLRIMAIISKYAGSRFIITRL